MGKSFGKWLRLIACTLRLLETANRGRRSADPTPIPEAISRRGDLKIRLLADPISGLFPPSIHKPTQV